MSAPRTVAAVLERLAAWAEDEGSFWQGDYCNEDGDRRCIEGELSLLATGDPRYPGMLPEPWGVVAEMLDEAAWALGYGSPVGCNDQGGLPAVRAMIARAREEQHET